jgi:aquaporin Z
MVMVWGGGHLSGGHYNPAMTLAALVRRRIGLRDAVAYWVVQLGAGVLAAVEVRAIVDPARVATATTMTLSGRTLLAAFVVELLFTFALCYVVLNVATSKDHPDNSSTALESDSPSLQALSLSARSPVGRSTPRCHLALP